ncbi:small ribosomal subunit protein uS11m isoform X1 [Salmo salar]|uniref:Small ribosomal subunit protein uS11m isoform X1 n=1 Tax=Salmo salar TaxID=8030 RepID=A0ABM3E0G7_SALSA|nr:28S ribosomal protein S11, mitochondrial isoform X1 [Salmo salar]
MYKLNVILSHSGRRACQQVAGSFNAGGSICGTSSLQRAVSSSAVRLQEEASVSATPGKISKEFSHLPPMPGQDSVLRWAGKKYEELPIAHIKATYNNTHVQVTDCEGQFMVRTSCGTEGFKNVKKSTPIAAQTAGISAAAVLFSWSEGHSGRSDVCPRVGERSGSWTLVCHQGFDHGRIGGCVHHRQHPRTTQWLSPSQG